MICSVHRKRTAIVLAIIVSLGTLTGCPKGNSSQPQRSKLEQARRDIVTQVDRASGALTAIGEAKRQLAANGTLSRDEELPLTNALLDANSVATEIKDFGNGLKDFTAADKQSLLALFDKGLKSISALNDAGVLKIKNPEARSNINTLVITVRTALAAARAIAAALDAASN